jgi:hypothetical protein
MTWLQASAVYLDASSASDVGSPNAGDSSRATVGQSKPGATMAKSPMLATDATTMGRHRDVIGHDVGRETIRTNEVPLLSPQHHLLKSEQKWEKREQHKSMDNAMHIPRGYQQETPRVGLHGQGLLTPEAQ